MGRRGASIGRYIRNIADIAELCEMHIVEENIKV